jgi:ankyrin repeat protein
VAARGARAGSFDDFFAAIKRNNLSPLLGLLLRGFDVNTLDEKGLHGLHVALRADSLEVAIYLATLTGVNVDSLTPQGESPLMIALLRGHFTVAQALVKHGADVNKPGWTPLHYAATHAGPDALAQVAFLLENHAYIDAESPNGTTPLMMAAQYGEPEVLRLLLKEGADARLANQQKLTAIDFAQRGSRPTSAEILRAHLQASPTPGKW